MATNGNNHPPLSATSLEANTAAGSTAEMATSANNINLSKDEIAWYFVEQYYNTLSKSPDRLHLFYGKRSQFVYGQEAEVANVSIGRASIKDRIKSLGLQETAAKVRVSNVDSQTSFDNIVIQVIGETSSMEGEDPKKFTQTFVLAAQPDGYFVLNDILRYIREEEEDEPQPQNVAVEAGVPEAAATDTKEEVKDIKEIQEINNINDFKETKPATQEPVAAADTLDANAVDEKLEGTITKDTSHTMSLNGDSTANTPTESFAAAEEEIAEKPETEHKPEPESQPEVESKSAESKADAESKATMESKPDPVEAAKEIAEEDVQQPEKPVDPSPTPNLAAQVAKAPAPAPAPPKTAAPAAAPPQKPLTWAGRFTATLPKPAVPLAKASTPPAATQSRTVQAPVPVPGAAVRAPAAASTPAQPTEPAIAHKDRDKDGQEWQTAGDNSKKYTRPQSVSSSHEREGTMGYVKYVTDKVDADDLRAVLGRYGELVYFDINRQKSCAFVEYATTAAYQAAIGANPHKVGGESITIEARRPKAGAYGYNTSNRGNAVGRGGRGGYDNRQGAQNGRGGAYGGGPARGGGGANSRGGPPRGRGASQAAAA